MKFVLRTDKPFRGNAQSVLTDDGLVAWSGGLTPAEYERERGYKIRIVDEDEMAELIRVYVDGQVTPWTPETHEAWDYALEVLPPSRYGTRHGVLLFHICERITHDLVAWHARTPDGRCFTRNARSTEDTGALARGVLDLIAAEGAKV